MTPPPLIGPDDALFLDLDGTIAPIEATPALVAPSGRRTRLLQALAERQGGALAILSGRTMEDIDRILDLSACAVSAVHGLVRRGPDGVVSQLDPAPQIAEAREWLEPLVRSRPGLLLEDKRYALAVHYRQAEPVEAAVAEACERISAATGLSLQRGRMVCELRTPGPNKGDALGAFMSELPFAGRRPIMVGDDLTDEDAFAAANELGGFGVLVGPQRPTAAQRRLPSVDAVLAWLSRSLEEPLA
jgi:trehalose 6-phosphate phosphatase